MSYSFPTAILYTFPNPNIKFKKKTKKKYLKLTLALTLPELLVELKLAKLALEPLLALLLTSFYN